MNRYFVKVSLPGKAGTTSHRIEAIAPDGISAIGYVLDALGVTDRAFSAVVRRIPAAEAAR